MLIILFLHICPLKLHPYSPFLRNNPFHQLICKFPLTLAEQTVVPLPFKYIHSLCVKQRPLSTLQLLAIPLPTLYNQAESFNDLKLSQVIPPFSIYMSTPVLLESLSSPSLSTMLSQTLNQAMPKLRTRTLTLSSQHEHIPVLTLRQPFSFQLFYPAARTIQQLSP